MKIAIAVLLLAGFVALSGAHSALAEGGKVRADGATGPAYQLGEVPFVG